MIEMFAPQGLLVLLVYLLYSLSLKHLEAAQVWLAYKVQYSVLVVLRGLMSSAGLPALLAVSPALEAAQVTLGGCSRPHSLSCRAVGAAAVRRHNLYPRDIITVALSLAQV